MEEIFTPAITENETNDEIINETRTQDEIDIKKFLLHDKIYKLISHGLADFDNEEDIPEKIIVSDRNTNTGCEQINVTSLPEKLIPF